MTKELKVYNEEDVQEKIAQELPDWYRTGNWIGRDYQTDGWPATIMLVNAIAYLAEAADHHPDLTISWAKVGVRLQTHTAGGVTDKDFSLARQIEAVTLWRPDKESAR
jgi:4a-hydroxytetrahydrobiopterin dehydratase